MSGLCISRKVGEKFTVGNNVTITVIRIGRIDVGIHIECPKDVRIERDDMRLRKVAEGKGGD